MKADIDPLLGTSKHIIKCSTTCSPKEYIK